MNALEFNYWLRTHWKMLLLIIVGLIVLGQTIFQIVYPSSRLVPNTVVDGVPVGGMKYAEAADKLDGLYGKLKLKIFFGKNDAAFREPTMDEVGVGVDNLARLEAMDYPFYLRFVPFSIFVMPAVSQPGEQQYVYDEDIISNYTVSQVGNECEIPAKNASLKLVNNTLQLIPSASGGKCNITELQRALGEVKPDSDVENSVRVDIAETPAPITDKIARDLAAKLNSRMAVPMPITVDDETDTIPGRIVLSWLDFTADVPEENIDNSGNLFARLLFDVNSERMEDYLNQGIASELIVEPGVSRVKTKDFKEVSRVNGTKGRALDMPKAVKSVENYINKVSDKAVAATKVVGPTTDYTRSYTPTSVGFRALLTQYDEDHEGEWAMAFQELSGVRYPRSASYRGDVKMQSGGVHSLYLAYTYKMERYAGNSRPVDKITASMDAEQCFEEMIQKFDYACRTGFYNHFGFTKLTNRAKQLGLKNTVYASEDTKTSANDLNMLLTGLYKNDIARKEGGSEILSVGRTSRSNDGIPSGVGTWQVSHFIGDDGSNIKNDAGIVYNTQRGAYAISILTDGGSWEDIAGLVEMIEALKKVEIPKDAR